MMENKEPVTGGTSQASETTTPSFRELSEFYTWWKQEQAAAAEKKVADEKTAKVEADRAERDQRIAGAVYANQAQRQKRAFKRAAAAAAAAALTAAIPIFLAVLAGDQLEEK